MLVVLGDIKGFEDGVKKVTTLSSPTVFLHPDIPCPAPASYLQVISTVSFDSDLVVSVFETNIRVVGGLLSAHVLAEHVQVKPTMTCSTPHHGLSQSIQPTAMAWYRGELLNMALDCATRLLPAFNSTTGLLLLNILCEICLMYPTF